MNPSASNLTHTISARRNSVYWRVHFWAALIASPFALLAMLTGILYIFTPQIESALYGSLDHVQTAGTMRSLDDSLAAARAAAPAGWVVHSAIPAFDAHDTVKVNFVPPSAAANADTGHQGHEGPEGHEGHNHAAMQAAASASKPAFGLPAKTITVYVDPYTSRVAGSLAGQDRFGSWAKKLHSRLLQSDGWRWMIELTASWLMVMLVTGIALWWPTDGKKALPQKDARGRIAWKQWHAFMGVALCAVSFTMLATGLTWSKYAGGEIRALRDATGQAPPRAPAGLTSRAASNGSPLSWQAAWDAVRLHAPAAPVQMTPPRDREGTWRITTAERGEPTKHFDMVLDAYTGQTLYYAGWDKQTAFAKATAIGIPFHRGEFGLWNQAVLLVFGAGVLFSLVSGWVMFIKRARVGRESGPALLPRLLPGAVKSLPIGAWLAAVVMLVAMPLLAASAFMVLLLELVGTRRARLKVVD